MEYVVVPLFLLFILGVVIGKAQKQYAMLLASGCSEKVAKWLIGLTYFAVVAFVTWAVWG